MPLTLKQLRYALALADTGHFGRAAERMHVTQPALSQQIAQLEALCSSHLFDRLGKAVQPTPFGREFLVRARGIAEAADELQAFAEGQAGKPTGPLRFGLIPTVAPYLLPEIFLALNADFPEVTLQVSESRTDALLKGLGNGELDLILIATDPPPGGPRLTIAPLFADPFVLAAPQAAAPLGPVSLANLPREKILLLDEGHCLRDQAIAACGLDADPAARAFAATSLTTIVEFVAAGQGVTLLPEIALRKEATDPRIAIRQLEAPGAGRMLTLVWREATPFATLFQAMAATIARVHGNGDQAGTARAGRRL